MYIFIRSVFGKSNFQYLFFYKFVSIYLFKGMSIMTFVELFELAYLLVASICGHLIHKRRQARIMLNKENDLDQK
jgi:hypothetical protein